MAAKFFDRIKDTSTTTGTGNVTVSGVAPTGFKTLSAVLITNDTFYYGIVKGAEWEIGLGTYTSVDTFSRSVRASSNSNNLVSFSVGTADVFMTAPAEFFTAAVIAATLAANTFTGDQTLGNNNVKAIKTATFNSQLTIAGASGAQTIDWSAGQNYKQTEPSNSITYTFTAPPGPCHLQLLIDSDGTSTAQTITWPTLTWIGSTWAGTNNKKAIINFWYDGTNYFAMGANQV